MRPRPGPSGNTAGEKIGDALGERGEPWCHVLAVSSLLTAAPDRYPLVWCRGKGSGLPPRRANAGPVRRGDSNRTTSLPSRVGAYKPVAEGGIVALELSASGPNRGQPGAPGDRRQLTVGLDFKQLGASVRSAHCFRVSPDHGESWSTAMGSGRRHRQVQRRELQGKIVKI